MPLNQSLHDLMASTSSSFPVPTANSRTDFTFVDAVGPSEVMPFNAYVQVGSLA